jgi:hypothetical protein
VVGDGEKVIAVVGVPLHIFGGRQLAIRLSGVSVQAAFEPLACCAER